jgi:hypothetical protein
LFITEQDLITVSPEEALAVSSVLQDSLSSTVIVESRSDAKRVLTYFRDNKGMYSI